MKRFATVLALSASGDSTPPTEVRLFAAGYNPSTKGTFLFDEEAARCVMQAASERGVEFPFDYAHGMTDPLGMLNPSEAGKAAGWFKLEVRDGALWAVDIRWTEPAAAAIAAKEWRYFSPSFRADDSGRVLELLCVGLTNTPALHNLTPLVAASVVDETAAHPKEHRMKTLLIALGLADTATEAEAVTALSRLTSGIKDVLTATATASLSEAVGAIQGMKAAADQVKQLSAQLAELQAAQAAREVESIVEAGMKEGKITPAQKDVMLSMGTKDIEMLKGFLATAPKIVAGKEHKEPGAGGEASLSGVDRTVAQLLGVDPKTVAETKAKLTTAA